MTTKRKVHFKGEKVLAGRGQVSFCGRVEIDYLTKDWPSVTCELCLAAKMKADAKKAACEEC